MIAVGGQIHGLGGLQAAGSQASEIIMDELGQATRASLFQVTRTAQQKYLSGPRPERLGVVTNRLRGSLSEGDPDFVFDVTRRAFIIEGRVGTNVLYGPTHEFGATIKPKRGQYLAVPTALAKTAAGALKDAYNRPLRQIVGLFIARSKDKRTLFAAIRSPATGRQRRSGFTVLFWLVRQVRIPARPFLNPALRDSTPWIMDRVRMGLGRVEQRINALMRGR
jgi:phage gpG-like protein